VSVRLTIVNHNARRAVALDEPLPGGCAVVEAGDAGFAAVDPDTGRLTLAAAQLPPGIYQYRYLLRAIAAGRYRAPAATIRLVDGDLIGAGNAAALTVDRVTR
jgi:hypothetical protein